MAWQEQTPGHQLTGLIFVMVGWIVTGPKDFKFSCNWGSRLSCSIKSVLISVKSVGALCWHFDCKKELTWCSIRHWTECRWRLVRYIVQCLWACFGGQLSSNLWCLCSHFNVSVSVWKGENNQMQNLGLLWANYKRKERSRTPSYVRCDIMRRVDGISDGRSNTIQPKREINCFNLLLLLVFQSTRWKSGDLAGASISRLIQQGNHAKHP